MLSAAKHLAFLAGRLEASLIMLSEAKHLAFAAHRSHAPGRRLRLLHQLHETGLSWPLEVGGVPPRPLTLRLSKGERQQPHPSWLRSNRRRTAEFAVTWETSTISE
jgi:hypothetical protein